MADYNPIKPKLSREVELTVKILDKVTLATLTDIKLLASRLNVPQTARLPSPSIWLPSRLVSLMLTRYLNLRVILSQIGHG